MLADHPEVAKAMSGAHWEEPYRLDASGEAQGPTDDERIAARRSKPCNQPGRHSGHCWTRTAAVALRRWSMRWRSR